MLYEVYLTKRNTKTIQLYAESPQEAVKLARQQSDGFRAEEVNEVLSDTEYGKEMAVIALCEVCGEAIIDGDKYKHDFDDCIYICERCHSE